MSTKGMAVNLPRAKNYGSDYIFFFSRKNMCEVHAESQLEHAVFIGFEMDPDIRSYTAHPVIIAGEELLSESPIFDALVEYKDGHKELIEVKYESDISGDSERATQAHAQIERQKNLASALGIEHRVITDQDVFGDPARHANNLFMYIKLRHMNKNVVNEKAKEVIEVLSDGEVHTADTLIECAGSYDDLLDILVFLLSEGRITADIGNTPLSYATEVELVTTKGVSKCRK